MAGILTILAVLGGDPTGAAPSWSAPYTELVEREAIDGTATTDQGHFDLSVPRTISVTLVIDGSGGIGSEFTVAQHIDAFERLVLDFDGQIHTSNTVSIDWGGGVMEGNLTAMNVDNTLFSGDGVVLRAMLGVEFEERVPDEARPEHRSPDLMHLSVTRTATGLKVETVVVPQVSPGAAD